MTKVLITGSSGMLGEKIFSAFLGKADYTVFGIDKVFNPDIPNKKQFVGDLTNYDFLNNALNKVCPNIIIHCAAITNIKTCENYPELTNSLHVKVSKQLANYNNNKAKVLYISTDSIFDGKKGNYSENDTPNPLNNYSKTKLEGEKEIISSNQKNLIIRTNIFGFNTPLKDTLAEWAINNFILGKKIYGFTDIIFNAIYIGQLAEKIIELLDNDKNGIINIASKNILSKYSFLKYLSVLITKRTDLVEPIISDKINKDVNRPKITTLDITKASNFLYLPTIESGIEELVNNYKKIQNEKN